MRRTLPLLVLATACRSSSEPAAAPPAPSVIVQPPASGPAIKQRKVEGALDDPRAQAIRAGYAKYEYRIPMRDGVRLFTAVYVPVDAGPKKPYPIMLHRTPYSVAPYGADRYPPGLGLEAMEKEGYIFVQQDVRGTHMSEGEFVHVRPHVAQKRKTDIDESTDTYDTIEWLLANLDHHNGKVGMTGISYPGFYTSAGAIDSHKALVAISPQAPVADWWHGDDMHRNGAFNLQESYVFFGVWRVGAPQPEPRADYDREKYEFGTPDGYRYFLEKGPLSEIDASDFGWDPPFWNDLRAHPDYDDFWKARNLLPHLKNIRAACLVVGGWYDTENLYGALETYRSIEALNPRLENTIIMGPWLHGAWEYLPGDQLGDDVLGFETSMAYRELAVEFWRHHLKGGPRPALPEALVFETGADRWRRFDAWPPREARATALYLREDKGLSFDPPTGQGADDLPSDPDKPVPYTYKPLADYWHAGYMAEDQRFVASRPDVLVYRTAPLTEDLTIAGPIEVELQVSTTGTDADFVVKLVDGYPGDQPGTPRGEPDPSGHQQLLIRGEPFRGRYRNGDDRPQPFVPNEVATIRFTLDDVFHTFQRGHQIVIHVQPSWFPFVDRNPQTYVPNIFEAKRSDFVKATHRVHWSAAAPSKITVNLLPAPDAAAR